MLGTIAIEEKKKTTVGGSWARVRALWEAGRAPFHPLVGVDGVAREASLEGPSLVREGPGEPWQHAPTPRLSERARDAIRLRHFSPRTEEAYLGWMRRYHEFHGRRDPAGLGPEHVTAFLNALATRRHVAASTQNQALAALLFLYREVRGIQLPVARGPRARQDTRAASGRAHARRGACRARAHRRRPAPDGDPALRCGPRLLECCRLRVKDVDFGRNQITVRRGKGDFATQLLEEQAAAADRPPAGR